MFMYLHRCVSPNVELLGWGGLIGGAGGRGLQGCALRQSLQLALELPELGGTVLHHQRDWVPRPLQNRRGVLVTGVLDPLPVHLQGAE